MITDKVSNNPKFVNPDAFSKQFPKIVETDKSKTGLVIMGYAASEKGYKMGPIKITISPPDQYRNGYFMSIHGRDRLPTWDEVVWIRYNLIPDAAVMTLILPCIDNYINYADPIMRHVFTLEQIRWELNPTPTCVNCGQEVLQNELVDAQSGVLTMPCKCGEFTAVDGKTWNEEHGNGLLGKYNLNGKPK